MKHSKRLFQALTLAAVLACGICIGTAAAGRQQQVTATLDPDVTVTVDGVTQQFFDAKGNAVFPLMYNGSTYLPMRAVCEQLAGYKVGWDQATRTASIATKDVDGVDLIDEYKAYDMSTGNRPAFYVQSSDNKTIEISGFTLNHWLGVTVDHYVRAGGFGHVSLNVMAKYDTVTFKYYATENATLQVIGDNDTVLFEKEITGGQVAQEVTVDLLKTNQLTFQFTKHTGGDMSGYIFDARLK